MSDYFTALQSKGLKFLVISRWSGTFVLRARYMPGWLGADVRLSDQKIVFDKIGFVYACKDLAYRNNALWKQTKICYCIIILYLQWHTQRDFQTDMPVWVPKFCNPKRKYSLICSDIFYRRLCFFFFLFKKSLFSNKKLYFIHCKPSWC